MVELKTAPTFVLVHGAWADGSSWQKVIEALQADGAKAVTAPIPLTSISDDVRALAPDRVVELLLEANPSRPDYV